MRLAKHFLLAAAVAAVGVLAIASEFGLDPARSGERAVVSAPAEPHSIVALGLVEAISGTVKIAAPSAADSGRIARLMVEEGDWVEAGQVLAVFDTQPRLAARVEQARAQLAESRALLARTVADLDSQRDLLQAIVVQRKADRDRAGWDLERQSRLKDAGVYKEASLVERDFALKAADAQVIHAELQLKRTNMQDADGRRIDEAEKHASLLAAEAALAVAEAELAYASLKAPLSGRILKLRAKVGEQIGSDGFADIADTRQMRVRAEVFEEDMARIAVGQGVEVSARSLDAAITGVVERTGLRIQRQSIVGDDAASREDARVVEILIRLDAASSARVATLTGLRVRCRFVMAGAS